MKKYRELSGHTSGAPPSQRGSPPLMNTPTRDRSAPHSRAAMLRYRGIRKSMQNALQNILRRKARFPIFLPLSSPIPSFSSTVAL